MTYEEGLKLNAFKAKMFTKFVKGQIHTITINYTYNVVVEIVSVRDPKCSSKYSNFKTNVKVVSCIKKVVRRDVKNTIVMDENNQIIYDNVEVKSIPRNMINSVNRTIRVRVENELSKLSPFFSIETWNVNVDRVLWP
jgi:hypothetical protein